MLPLDDKILRAISTLSPSAAEITNIMTAFASLDPQFLKLLLSTVDEAMLRKIATWAEAFSESLNRVAKFQNGKMESHNMTDFDAVMLRTKWQGPILDLEMLDEASNIMTKAIKAENWIQAINVAVSIVRAGA